MLSDKINAFLLRTAVGNCRLVQFVSFNSILFQTHLYASVVREGESYQSLAF